MNKFHPPRPLTLRPPEPAGSGATPTWACSITESCGLPAIEYVCGQARKKTDSPRRKMGSHSVSVYVATDCGETPSSIMLRSVWSPAAASGLSTTTVLGSFLSSTRPP